MREDLAGLCLEERMMSEGSGVNDADVTTPENEAEDKEQEAKWIEMQAQTMVASLLAVALMIVLITLLWFR